MTTFPTLADRLVAGRLPEADALRLAAACAERLRQLHDRGCVHGALTPSLIVFTESDVDFQHAPLALTPYTAPELLDGHPADERTDIFSFGAILFEMFTGMPAFEGDEVSIAAALTTTEP